LIEGEGAKKWGDKWNVRILSIIEYENLLMKFLVGGVAEFQPSGGQRGIQGGGLSKRQRSVRNTGGKSTS